MSRTLIVVALLLFSGLILALAAWVEPTTALGSVFLNLGTEAIGILLTVAFIEVMSERHRRADNARKMAMRALQRIDSDVWLWQGGRRAFSRDELVQLLRMVSNQDQFADVTLIRLIELGADAEDSMRLDADIMKANPRLASGMKSLAGIAALGDGGEVPAPADVARSLLEAVEDFSAAANYPVNSRRRASGPIYRDASVPAQRRRYFGDNGASVSEPVEADQTEAVGL